jgi:MtrB/PioB family decaheme-associated outer membrane protein
MKTRNGNFAVRALAIAVQGALTAMVASPLVAYAADEIAELKRPDNYVEIGVANVDKASAKFGEYNGLKDKGASLIGNFNVRGGNAYDGTGTMRFEFSGKDIGTTSREFGVSAGEQGRWSFKFGYDELQHNLSDTYQTPFQQKMGGNTFTLPNNFGLVDTAVNKTIASTIAPGITLGTPLGAGIANWVPGTRAMTPGQLGAFHTEEISSTRKNTSFALGFQFDPQWSVELEFNRLDQEGAKLHPVITSSYSPVTLPVPSAGAATWKNQGSIMAASPTNYQTNTLNLGLNWKGEKGHVTAAYFGSFFKDGYNSYSVESPMAGASTVLGTTLGANCGVGVFCYPTNTMSTAPNNILHQFNLSGGYAFSKTTRLAGGFSYGRNTQNDSFMAEPMVFSNPFGGSLNGLVITRNVNLKLTDQSIKDLTLSAGYKFNERDNRTASNIIGFYDVRATYAQAGGAAGALLGGTDTNNRWPSILGAPVNNNPAFSNLPFSNKKAQLELAGDYRIGKGQNVRLSYEREEIDRWCNSVAQLAPLLGNAMGGAPVGTARCAVAASSSEDKLAVSYKHKLAGGLNYGLSYAYGDRRGTYDQTLATDWAGFRPYHQASRKQDQWKANINWQAAEQLTLGAGFKYATEKYPDSALGDKDGETQGLNLDATYSYSDTGTLSAFASWQNKKKNGFLQAIANSVVAANITSNFYNRQKDTDQTFGISFNQKGLAAGKLDLSGDLTWSKNVTAMSTEDAGYNARIIANAGNTLTSCFASNISACGALPNIEYNMLQFKLVGDYKLDVKSKVAVYYVYQKLTSSDWYYNGYQYGYTASAQMPTNEQAPSYSASAIGVSYNYSFK